jgi:hypothetical protein
LSASAVVAVVSALALLGYLAVIDWIDLFPWNDISAVSTRVRLRTSLTNYAPLVVVAIAFLIGGDVLQLIGLGIAAVDVCLNAAFWWAPYLLGATGLQGDEYEKSFSRTRKSLPPISNHPIPDDEHVVVSVLMWTMLASAIVVVAG